MIVTKAYLIFKMYEEYMKLHKKKLAKNYKGTYLFEIRSVSEKGQERQQYFFIDFNQMKINFSETPFSQQADVTFSTNDDIMHKIINRKVSPQKMMLSKDIQTEGNIEYARKFDFDFFPTLPRL